MPQKNSTGPQSFKDIFATKKSVKPPAHPWQDLALRVINELNIPPVKRSAIFRVCKIHSKSFIERCLNETKELAKEGEAWRYFFKLIAKPTINPIPAISHTVDTAINSPTKKIKSV